MSSVYDLIVIGSGPAGQRADYRDLIAAASALPIPSGVKLKTPDQFTLLGTRPRRDELCV